MFRFSLRTLVLVSLWCGAAMAVWRYRDPWQMEQHRTDGAGASGSSAWSVLSPDKTRTARISFDAGKEVRTRINIHDFDTKALLTTIDLNGYVLHMQFRDDNTLSCTGEFNCILRRRFPEWWWGQLMRPENWMIVVLSLALGWTLVGWVRGRFAGGRPFAERKVTM